MIRLILFLFLGFVAGTASSQLVEVQANYINTGDCVFTAHNNARTPMFLHLNFGDLENTSFNETLPYVKRLEPGFNSLFTLERYPDAGVPRFNYEIKSYRSDPTSILDLDYPYLFPFEPGKTIKIVSMDKIDGFWGSEEPKSWNATGFEVRAGDPVYAARQGIIVEVVEGTRAGDPQQWYNTWNYTITLLQNDGTLAVYQNIINKNEKLKLNQKIHAGQVLGEVVSGNAPLIYLVCQHSISSADLRFVIPQFLVSEGKTGLAIPSKEYTVFHSDEVRGLEMSKKEKRKILGK